MTTTRILAITHPLIILFSTDGNPTQAITRMESAYQKHQVHSTHLVKAGRALLKMVLVGGIPGTPVPCNWNTHIRDQMHQM